VSFRVGGKPLTEEQAENMTAHPLDDYDDETPEGADTEGGVPEGEHGTWRSTWDGKVHDKGLSKVRDDLNEIEDLVEDVFGSNARIVVVRGPRGGVNIHSFDYACGY
jgi:hypothetical protein